MATYSNSAREVEMPNGDVVVLHSAPTGGANTTSNIKKFKYDDNGHVTESEAANATDLNLNSYSTPTTGSTAIGTSDAVQTAIGKLDHQSQIDQTNILYVLGKTGKNLLSKSTLAISGLTWHDIEPIKAGLYIVTGRLPNTASNYSIDFRDENDNDVGSFAGVGWTTLYNDGMSLTLTGTATKVKIWAAGTSSGDELTTAMVCTPEDWAVGHDFAPYALPNYDLTYLQAEDRASLAEVVDSGAKNLANIPDGTITNVSGATITASNGVLTISGTATADAWITLTTIPNLSGTYVLSGIQATTTENQYFLRVEQGSNAVNDFGNGGTANFNGNGTLYLRIKSGYAFGSGTIIKPMLCTKAAFGVSNKFVPFGNDPIYQVPINHNMIYRGRNLGASLTDAQHTALSSGNFTDLYLGDYWTKTVTIPAGTYTGGDGEEVTVPAQTNITLKAVIADFDTFYAGYASSYAGINTHHAAVIVTGFSNVVWNKTNSTAGGYVASLIHKWLVGSALPQIETWFGSAKVLSHQKLLTNAITGDAASGWIWSSQKISLLSENQMYGSKVWGNSKAANGGYEPGEAFKHLNVFNHIDANLLFGNKNIWLRDIAFAGGAADLNCYGYADAIDASGAWVAPAALILLS